VLEHFTGCMVFRTKAQGIIERLKIVTSCRLRVSGYRLTNIPNFQYSIIPILLKRQETLQFQFVFTYS